MIISHTTERFRKVFAKLPGNVKKQARNAYKQFCEDPYHPSLHFKKVQQEKSVYSVRISDNYRAIGVKKENAVIESVYNILNYFNFLLLDNLEDNISRRPMTVIKSGKWIYRIWQAQEKPGG